MDDLTDFVVWEVPDFPRRQMSNVFSAVSIHC